MLRPLGAFLAMFSLLAIVVQLEELAGFFGGAALALLGIDLLLTILANNKHTSGAGTEPLPLRRRRPLPF